MSTSIRDRLLPRDAPRCPRCGRLTTKDERAQVARVVAAFLTTDQLFELSKVVEPDDSADPDIAVSNLHPTCLVLTMAEAV